jgi:hypothetical protein
MRALVLLCGAMLCSSVPARAVEASAVDEVEAVFETRIIAKDGASKTQRWTFRRHANWVEYEWHDIGVTEHWRIDARSNVSYSEAFHRERTIVRYTSGDLATLGLDPQWEKLNHVIVPPRDNTTFTPVFVSQAARAGQRYQVQDDATRSSVVWLGDLRLPAEVRSTTRQGRRVHVRLLEVKQRLGVVSAAPDRSYRTIDFADFGDMEYDPFVRRHAGHAHQRGVVPRTAPRISKTSASHSHAATAH